MKISNLEPKRYKRFFAFGCSFTNYNWPTWADIIGHDIECYENWAEAGAGNHFIFNSVMEADSKYHFCKDDLIMIMWSIKEREDRYLHNQWMHSNVNSIEKDYGKEWVKKYFLDTRSFFIRDLAYIKATQSLLSNRESDWANIMWHDFMYNKTVADQYHDSKNKDAIYADWTERCKSLHNGDLLNTEYHFFDDIDVIEQYRDVFLNVDSVFKWYWYKLLPNRISPNNDVHPTPIEALGFLDWQWPNNTISASAREYASSWNDKIFNGERKSLSKVDRL